MFLFGAKIFELWNMWWISFSNLWFLNYFGALEKGIEFCLSCSDIRHTRTKCLAFQCFCETLLGWILALPVQLPWTHKALSALARSEPDEFEPTIRMPEVSMKSDQQTWIESNWCTINTYTVNAHICLEYVLKWLEIEILIKRECQTSVVGSENSPLCNARYCKFCMAFAISKMRFCLFVK